MSFKLFAFALALACITWGHDASATAVGCKAIEAKGVLINHCSNHGYYPRSLDFELPHAAAGVAELRRRLIAERKLDDLPILIELPAFPRGAHIAISSECARDTGDGDADETKPPSKCYRIVAGKIAPSYDALRTLVTALASLSKTRPNRAVNDLAKLEGEVGGRRHRGIVISQRPIRAPAGKLALVPVWRDGKLELSLTNAGARLRSLPELRGYLATAPRWSRDGTRVVYSSLHEVNVHDADKTVTVTFTLADWIGPDLHQVVAALDSRNRRLLITGDTNLFSGYRTWIFEIDGTRAVRIADQSMLPRWAEQLVQSEIDKAASAAALR